MKFQLKPILKEIKALYSKPISNERFEEYISKLQGDTKGDLKLPISGFNPMAKTHIIKKIEELEAVNADLIMKHVINEFNSNLKESNKATIEVVLNLADDLKGAWTNFYSTDFDSKFKLNAFVKRNFCVPYFWTSEVYTEKLIQQRTIEYLNRTLFWLNNPKPKTLEDHLEQEIFVYKNARDDYAKSDASKFESIETYYLLNKQSEDYNLIFNFFYGDAASENLGYRKYGFDDTTGFEYAKLNANKKKLNNQ